MEGKLIWLFVLILMVTMSCGVVADDETVEASPWERAVALSYDKKSGNTDKSSLQLDLSVKWEVESMQWTFSGNDSYGTTDGDKDVDKGKADTEYRYIFSNRMYANAYLGAKYDKIADLDYRYVPGIGVGYSLVKTKAMQLSASVGPTYVVEKYASKDRTSYWAGQFDAGWNWKLKQGTKLWAKGRYNVRADDSETYLLNGEAGIEAPLGKGLGLRLVCTDSYNNKPAADKKRNDLTLSTGISYSF